MRSLSNFPGLVLAMILALFSVDIVTASSDDADPRAGLVTAIEWSEDGLFLSYTNLGTRHRFHLLTGVREALGLAKETIDALLPYEKYGRFGGDGFSKNDLVYDLLGIGIAYTIDKVWEKKSYENKSIGIKVSPGYVWFSIYLD